MNISRTPRNLKLCTTALGLVMSVAAGNVFADDHGQKAMANGAQHAEQHARVTMQQDEEGARTELTGATKNAWQHGKLETALMLNKHLSNFSIDSKVEDGVATLYGTVESEIDHELAKQVAMNIDGITEVNSELVVDRAKAERFATPYKADGSDRSLARRLSDATTTAVIKTKLLANGETEGFDINVDTINNRVTLRGEVDSDAERMLATSIAKNTDDVVDVDNQLIIETDDDDDKEEAE